MGTKQTVEFRQEVMRVGLTMWLSSGPEITRQGSIVMS